MTGADRLAGEGGVVAVEGAAVGVAAVEVAAVEVAAVGVVVAGAVAAGAVVASVDHLWGPDILTTFLYCSPSQDVLVSVIV